MNILITGATGFVGTHLVRRLAERPSARLAALVRSGGRSLKTLEETGTAIHPLRRETLRADIDLAMGGFLPDMVVHLAAHVPDSTPPEPVDELVDSNLLLGSHVLDAMARHGVRRFLNTGSFWEERSGGGEYDPVDLYAATKRAFESIAGYYVRAHGLRVVTLKLFGNYGPDDPRPKVFAHFDRAAESREPVPFSPGEQVMDLVYVEDVAAAYTAAIDHLLRGAEAGEERFEVGTGVGLTLRQVAEVYQECLGRPLNIAWGGRPYRPREVMRRVADIAATRAVLGWEPRHDLRAGFLKMLRGAS